MTTTNTQPTEENVRIQAIINLVAARMGNDTAFKAQYEADPKAALTGAGLPDSAVGQVVSLIAKSSGDDEVSGYDYDSSGGYHYEYTPSTANSSSTSRY